ncbi:hypothetical protein [Thermoflavimicrobium dichotomicum]|uniref:Uncharacterized protein n=1 Tax=Thermoflavimicrobium dichotomicum TaxID=46223 RepID=A0A1I3RZ20_9BACL|nr:hypothetical protein [Thermoflavimicrobium dichotomicum]SFJ50537.1 hypothetical protein SAMN05421852_11154 [Thermoflavimicrobium dichotomicum]
MDKKSPYELLEFFRTDSGHPLQVGSTEGSPIDYKKLAKKIGATVMVSALSAGVLAGCVNDVNVTEGVKQFDQLTIPASVQQEATAPVASTKKVEINLSKEQFREVVNAVVKAFEQKQIQNVQQVLAKDKQPKVEVKSVDDLAKLSPFFTNIKDKSSLLDIHVKLPEEKPKASVKKDKDNDKGSVILASKAPILPKNKQDKDDEDRYIPKITAKKADDKSKDKEPVFGIARMATNQGSDKNDGPLSKQNKRKTTQKLAIVDDFGKLMGYKYFYSDGSSKLKPKKGYTINDLIDHVKGDNKLDHKGKDDNQDLIKKGNKGLVDTKLEPNPTNPSQPVFISEPHIPVDIAGKVVVTNPSKATGIKVTDQQTKKQSKQAHKQDQVKKVKKKSYKLAKHKSPISKKLKKKGLKYDGSGKKVKFKKSKTYLTKKKGKKSKVTEVKLKKSFKKKANVL